MRRPDLRIRVQLTVSVCLFTLVCLVSLAIAIYVLSRDTLLHLQQDNLDLNSSMLREECRQEFSDLYESFSRLSYSSPITDIFNNYTSDAVITEAANLLHDSFGLDRILLMKLYLPDGLEILEVDSKVLTNRSGLPHALLPLSYGGSNLNYTLAAIDASNGQFIGPIRAQKPIGGTSYMISLTLPVRDAKYGGSIYTGGGSTSPSNNHTIGYATFLINALRLQSILTSVSLSSATSEVGTAALCAARNNLTVFDQLIPFDDNIVVNSTQAFDTHNGSKGLLAKLSQMLPSYKSTDDENPSLDPGDSFPVPPKMADELLTTGSAIAEYNKGPQKSMISISPFQILNSSYYVVVLQSHKAVFSMPHKLRNNIIISSCVIGGSMIIFTFLFVSFGARQILRLKMAATYEKPSPSRWKFFPLPWWLRPVNQGTHIETSEVSELKVPEKVPLRKHVRDELDDITERFNAMSNELRKQCRRLEDRVEARKAEIEQARQAADIANAAKSHFLARVTHELRTPLNGIIGTATLCLEETDISQIHQSLRTIFKCGELLLHLMTELLSFSQNEVENLDLELRDFTLPDIITQLTAIFTEQCAAKHIELVVSADETEPWVFSGDTNRILQVVFNLMSNGIKFTPEGGRMVFRAKVIDDAVHGPDYKIIVFDVTDNGPGIAPDMQSKVFEAFVQGDISNQVKKAGVGLGLSICRQLADRMHGDISLQSALGVGSTFTFRVPLTYRIGGAGSSTDSRIVELDSLDALEPRHVLTHSTQNTDNSVGSANCPFNPFNGATTDSAGTVIANSTESAGTDQSGSVNPTNPERTLRGNIFAGTQKAREFLTRRKTSESVMRLKDIRGDASPKTPIAKTPPAIHKGMFRGRGSFSSPQREKLENPIDAVTGGEVSEMAVKPAVPAVKPGESPQDAAPAANDIQPEIKTETRPEAAASDIAIKQSGAKPIEAAVGKVSGPVEGPKESVKPKLKPIVPPLPTVVPDAHNATSMRPPMKSKKSFNGKPPPNLRVLVVDDNSVNQEVMVRMLNLEGLKNIKVAFDGLDALAKVNEAEAESQPFDVIFMDVQMPNMDGRQATRVIRTELHLTVPIVAVSAFANEMNAEDCLSAGMNLFLSKPLRRPHLREILRGLADDKDATAGGLLKPETPTEPPKSPAI